MPEIAQSTELQPMNGIIATPEGYRLTIDTRIYAIEAVKKAAYKFADRASIFIRPKSEAEVEVVFSFTGQVHPDHPEQVIADYCNELLDQDLREIIKKEAGPLRNLILAHAFSKTSLVEKE